MDPIEACAALHGLAPPRHISSAHRTRKDGARVGMNVTAHQEKEKNEETKKGKRKESGRPILKMLCAALLRSFSGQQSEKMKGSARGNWDSREGQQPFRPHPNGAGEAPPR